jgi:ABC-type Na+ transport system ATPase subunit NatA
VLKVEGLNVRYGKSHVVFDFSVDIGDGELLAVLGRNGAGKTTTIRGIVGLLPGASGKVSVGGRDMSGWPAHRRTRGGLAYVPSGARCFQNLTVDENLEIASHANGDGRGWTKKRIWELFPKLEPLKNNLAGGLSGGERQMLAVGRALMSAGARAVDRDAARNAEVDRSINPIGRAEPSDGLARRRPGRVHREGAHRRGASGHACPGQRCATPNPRRLSPVTSDRTLSF